MTLGVVLSALFWTGVCGALYAYVIFPAFSAFVARNRSISKVDAPAPDSQVYPPLTVIIPAHNEERSIGAKVRNVLASDYPAAALDVIVISDASTDRTDAIVRDFRGAGVRLLVQPRRTGKSAGLNRAVALARGDILVFTDANAAYPAATMKTLVTYFTRPRVGCVTGYTRYAAGEDGDVADVTNVYTSLERTIKQAESRWGCCVGADGAIFALRRDLYRTLQDDDINDVVIPLSAIEQGYECVLATDAWCSEQPGKALQSEFRRQSRITNRTLRAVWRHRSLLNPFRFPRFAFFLFSHKVMRFLVPFFVIMSLTTLPFVAADTDALRAGALVALAALVGAALLRAHMLTAFFTINVAMLDGWRKFLSGHREATWQHDRSIA